LSWRARRDCQFRYFSPSFPHPFPPRKYPASFKTFCRATNNFVFRLISLGFRSWGWILTNTTGGCRSVFAFYVSVHSSIVPPTVTQPVFFSPLLLFPTGLPTTVFFPRPIGSFPRTRAIPCAEVLRLPFSVSLSPEIQSLWTIYLGEFLQICPPPLRFYVATPFLARSFTGHAFSPAPRFLTSLLFDFIREGKRKTCLKFTF